MAKSALMRDVGDFAKALAKRMTGATDDDIVRRYHARHHGGARRAATAFDRLVRRAITPFVVTAGLALVVIFLVTKSEIVFYALVAFLPIGWLLVFALVTKSRDELPSMHALLRTFDRQVDHAKQNFSNDPKSVDDHVLRAFARMHDEVQTLLQNKKIRMSHVRREVLRFHAPDEPMGNRWRPPTLSEMGFVVAAAKDFSPDAPVLALYKFSGEHHSREGSVAETYTIVKEGSSGEFSAGFPAKIQSPFKVPLVISDEVRATLAAQSDATPRPPADTDRNVAYILSLLGPITHTAAYALPVNLRAMRDLNEDSAPPPPLSAAALHARLRGLFTEVDAHRDSSLRTARAALRQAPHLFVAALADVEGDKDDNHAGLRSALDATADILVPAPHPAQAGMLLALQRYALLLQSFTVLSAEQRLTHSSLVYIEARGAESDAEYLRRIAQLTTPAVPLLLMTTNFTVDEFQTQLRGYAELQPDPAQQTIIATLLQALRDGKLKLNTVSDNTPVKAKTLVGELGSKTLFLSANPVLVDMEGIDNPLAYVVWTLSGRALVIPGPQTQSVLSLAAEIAPSPRDPAGPMAGE